MLTEGMRTMRTCEVEETNTARQIGSGSLPVFGTPAMIALIEQTAVALLQDNLPDGVTTVGTRLEIDHVSATPIGMKVMCECILTCIDRKKLTFEVSVKDEAGVIGRGIHERFMVDGEKFMQKAEEKKHKK